MSKITRNPLVFSIFCVLILSSIFLIFSSLKFTFLLGERTLAETSCSIFTVKAETSVYFGNNEDEGGDRERTDMWFVSSDDGQSYGCVYVGFAENEPGGDDVDGIEIGGMNTEGLCFDGNGIVPGEDVNYREDLGSHYYYLTSRGIILRECATVEEVIIWYQTHNMGGTWWGQTHWADKTGDAVVVSPAVDGSIAFTRISGDFLISTNFNVDHPGGTYYPCPRYDYMTTRLNEITTTDNVSIENCAKLLDALHVPQTYAYAGTVYSNVYDLQQQVIYLYVHGNYEDVVILNLSRELAKGYHGYIIESLGKSTPEELYDTTAFWPIEPKPSLSSLIILLTLVVGPILMSLGYWIFVIKHIRKIKDTRGKKNGN
ncbi:MAG: hypothetical protein ACXABJ_06865 [Candidatus Heimdallarchaeaceae archaeon]|jgi:hypothetical protein